MSCQKHLHKILTDDRWGTTLHNLEQFRFLYHHRQGEEVIATFSKQNISEAVWFFQNENISCNHILLNMAHVCHKQANHHLVPTISIESEKQKHYKLQKILFEIMAHSPNIDYFSQDPNQMIINWLLIIRNLSFPTLCISLRYDQVKMYYLMFLSNRSFIYNEDLNKSLRLLS